MAVQNNLMVSCNPTTAFECAIRTLKTFQNRYEMYINSRFLTVTTTIQHHASGDMLTDLKVISITILPNVNGCSQMQLTCDFQPSKAFNKGSILLTIAEYLDRYSRMLDQMIQENIDVGL